MIRQAKQKQSDGDLRAAIRNDDQPCVPPRREEKLHHVLRLHVGEIFHMMAYSKVDEAHEDGETRYTQCLENELVCCSKHGAMLVCTYRCEYHDPILRTVSVSHSSGAVRTYRPTRIPSA